jgi:hypothetical protein
MNWSATSFEKSISTGLPLDLRERLLIRVLYDSFEKHEDWPSISTLSQWCSMPESQIETCLISLEDKGLIQTPKDSQEIRPDHYASWRKAIIDSRLHPTTKHILLTIYIHINLSYEPRFPNTTTLSKETGLSLRCILNHLALASEQGWVTNKKCEYGGHWLVPSGPHALSRHKESMPAFML